MTNDYYEAHVITGDAATDCGTPQIIIMMLQDDRKYYVFETIQLKEADEDTEVVRNLLARAGWRVTGSPTMGVGDGYWIVNVVATEWELEANDSLSIGRSLSDW